MLSVDKIIPSCIFYKILILWLPKKFWLSNLEECQMSLFMLCNIVEILANCNWLSLTSQRENFRIDKVTIFVIFLQIWMRPPVQLKSNPSYTHTKYGLIILFSNRINAGNLLKLFEFIDNLFLR